MAPMPTITPWFRQKPLSEDKEPSAFVKNGQHEYHTFNGTAAIARVVKELSLSSKNTVLLPAYCCGAEIGPFRSAGCKLRFYDIRPDMSIDSNVIEEHIQRDRGISLLFITHYFGVVQPELSKLA